MDASEARAVPHTSVSSPRRGLLGLVTICRSPGTDVREMRRWITAETVEVEILDGTDRDDIACYQRLSTEDVSLAEMPDSEETYLDAQTIYSLIQECILQHESHDTQATLIVCGKQFVEFRHARPPFRADPVLRHGMSALFSGTPLGLIFPAPSQKAGARKLWGDWQGPLFTGTATYDVEAIATAAQTLQARGARVLVLTTRDYTEKLRNEAARSVSIPTIQGSYIVARLADEAATL